MGWLTIIRVLKTSFFASSCGIEKLFACNRTSAQIWNDCLALAKDHHKQTGKLISKSDLHAATKGKYPIHSQSIQAVFEKYVDARENAKKARERGYGQIRYPYREKKGPWAPLRFSNMQSWPATGITSISVITGVSVELSFII